MIISNFNNTPIGDNNVLPVSKGGTGGTTPEGALFNLGASDAASHNIKTYYNLGQIGINDDELSATDFMQNIKSIRTNLTYSIFKGVIAGTTNLGKSILAKINDDCRVSYSDISNIVLTIDVLTSDTAIKIDAVVDTGSNADAVYCCIYNSSSVGNEKLSKFTEVYKEITNVTPRLNLFDNWYFGNPINQMEQTEYVGISTITIDRWFTNSNACLLTVSDGFIRMSNNTSHTSTASQALSQKVDNFKQLIGKTLVFSAFIKGENFKLVIKDGNTVIAEHENYTSFGDYSIISLSVTVPDTITNDFTCIIQGKNKGWYEVVAAKLEIGNVQTLVYQDINGNLTLSEIPDYADQLTKCQRYFIDLNPLKSNGYATYALGVAYDTSNAVIHLDLPVNMRTLPSLSVEGSLRLFILKNASGGTAAGIVVTDLIIMGVRSLGASKLCLTASVAGGLTAGDVVALTNAGNKNSTIRLTANL